MIFYRHGGRVWGMKGVVTTVAILFGFIALFSSSNSFAQEELSPTITLAVSITPSPTPRVDYQLPYPGLLPDNPLYFLKTFRDNIVSILISDTIKRTQFELLQADKHINAGLYLSKNNKSQLASESITKSQAYFQQAIVNLKKARSEGKDTNLLENRMFQAVKKHKDVLSSLQQKLKPKDQLGREWTKNVTKLEDQLNDLFK